MGVPPLSSDVAPAPMSVACPAGGRVLPAGLAVWHRRLDAGQHLRWQAHDRPTLRVFCAGMVDEVVEPDARTHSAGDVVFQPGPVRCHYHGGPGGAEWLTIEVEPWALEALGAGELTAGGAIEASCRRAIHLASLVQAALASADEAAEVEVTGLVCELLAIAMRERRGSIGRLPVWLVQVRERLARDLPRVATLSELARDTGVPSKRLSQVFREHYRLSIGDFVRQLKVERAVQLLTSSEKAISDIALDAGFYDQSHMTNVVRQYTGLTPGALRRTRPAAVVVAC